MRVTVCVRVCEAIQETMVWQCWEDDFKDAIAEHLKGTSTPTLSYKVKEREAAVQVPDVGRPAADLDTSACTSKEMLLAALDSQVAHINADLDRDYCTVNEQTLDAFDGKLQDMFRSGMVEKLLKLRKTDEDEGRVPDHEPQDFPIGPVCSVRFPGFGPRKNLRAGGRMLCLKKSSTRS